VGLDEQREFERESLSSFEFERDMDRQFRQRSAQHHTQKAIPRPENQVPGAITKKEQRKSSDQNVTDLLSGLNQDTKSESLPNLEMFGSDTCVPHKKTSHSLSPTRQAKCHTHTTTWIAIIASVHHIRTVYWL
jgi:microcompartment protein CcmL/EutN